MKTVKSLLVAMACMSCMSAFAAQGTYPVPAGQSQVGRYLTISNTKPADIGLSQIVQAKIPANIQTIGDALSYVLQGTGYALLPIAQCDPFIKNLYALPLPNRDRDLNPMSLTDFLSTIAGSQYQIVVDPVNRLITFKLYDQFEAIYGATVEAE